MSSIKIVDLQPDKQIKELQLFEAELKLISGGIQFQRLSNNIVDVTFGGFRIRL